MVIGESKKSRGAVAPGKRQVNWRLRVDLLEKAQAEATAKGFRSVPAFVEYILQARYYPEPAVKEKQA